MEIQWSGAFFVYDTHTTRKRGVRKRVTSRKSLEFCTLVKSCSLVKGIVICLESTVESLEKIVPQYDGAKNGGAESV